MEYNEETITGAKEIYFYTQYKKGIRLMREGVSMEEILKVITNDFLDDYRKYAKDINQVLNGKK